MTENELDADAETLAADRGIWSYHTRNSQGSERGWPDRVYLGKHGSLFRELKSEGGQPTPEQRRVGWKMRAAGLDWAIWRPVDLRCGRIERELDGIA